MKTILPNFITGSWKNGAGDKKPLENVYNTFFVRIPTVMMAIVYATNLVKGHGLIMNVGYSDFEVPPLIVLSIIIAILR